MKLVNNPIVKRKKITSTKGITVEIIFTQFHTSTWELKSHYWNLFKLKVNVMYSYYKKAYLLLFYVTISFWKDFFLFFSIIFHVNISEICLLFLSSEIYFREYNLNVQYRGGTTVLFMFYRKIVERVMSLVFFV